MNSTRPTTSASGAIGAAVAIGLAALAGVVLYAKSRDLWGSFSLSRAGAALTVAQENGPGAARDKALAEGASSAQSGITASPDDPRLWDTIAEIRLQQAVSGAVGQVSPTLLLASANASVRAAQLSPHDGAAQARLAFVKSLQRDGAASVTALDRSYTVDFDAAPTYAARRLAAAGRVWNVMDDRLRRKVVGEACALAARSDDDRAQVITLRETLANEGMAPALDQVLANPTCSANPTFAPVAVPVSAPAAPKSATPPPAATKP